MCIECRKSAITSWIKTMCASPSKGGCQRAVEARCYTNYVFLRLTFYTTSFGKSPWKRFSYTPSEAKAAVVDIGRTYSMHYGNDYNGSSFSALSFRAHALCVESEREGRT